MTATPQSAAKSAAQGSLYQFFGPGGMLAGAHPAYEFRRGQLEMAQAVEQALAEKRHLIVEAGTGTGKTLAYLVPVIRAGKRVVISTGTKNLQEQLFQKDVPFLEQVFFPKGEGKLRVCYMKGRNNYLCRQKLYDLANQPALSGLEQIEQFEAIADWEKRTESGDRAELGLLPEASALWSKLDARAEACTGMKCKQFERCFITEMHRRATASDIIIVNHHLFFADLAIRQSGAETGILPEFAAVIFDEAHELEEVAGDYFGIAVSTARTEDLARDVEHTLKLKNLSSASLLSALAALRRQAQIFFSLLPHGPSSDRAGRASAESRFAFESRAAFLEEHGDHFLAFTRALGRVMAELKRLPDKPEEVHNLARRAEELAEQLRFVLETSDRNTVVWIERRHFERAGRSAAGYVAVQATPIEVGPILRKTLFEQAEVAVLTSATLAVGDSFQYIRGRLGLEHTRELVVPSHFDYASQAMLYVPPDLPDPRSSQFAARAAERIREIVQITRGRAFCLFTSYNQMHEVWRLLEGELGFPMLLQGSAPRTVLLDEFRLTPHAVLFATSSFWQGVDVQGEQLSCVIIDRLPFAVPSDPVVAARIRAVNEDGGNAFFDYQVPAAVIALKQGFGRLIRSLSDRGLLALLDNRIVKQRYGRVFLESLPPYGRTTRLEDVEAFFGQRSGILPAPKI